ncbi:MAG: hypothetical protein RBS08_09570 [Bdellovibrionales bacterium]|jgi:hypothetical protein|nr:hypothetical protein [Bdellovibrionales bacterium]
MRNFSTSLVREKMEFIQDGAEGISTTAVVRSNRVYLHLPSREDSGIVDKVVIRTQTMPTALRLAGKVMFSYYRNDVFSQRTEPYDWAGQWESVQSGYDRHFMPDLWAAVYMNGKSVFKTINSPFVDIVEHCALLSLDNYDAAIHVTEDMLRKLGRDMRIQHVSSVAATLADDGKEMRCGIIHRSEGRDATFSFMAAGGADASHRVVQSFGTAAAFLEAVNLQIVTRSMRDKIQSGEVPKASPEATKLRIATARMTAIDKAINSFEDMYSVKYRPAKPDFFGLDDGIRL